MYICISVYTLMVSLYYRYRNRFRSYPSSRLQVIQVPDHDVAVLRPCEEHIPHGTQALNEAVVPRQDVNTMPRRLLFIPILMIFNVISFNFSSSLRLFSLFFPFSLSFLFTLSAQLFRL